MELKKKQKDFVIKCVGEGLETDEINARAARCKPPFSVSRQQVDYFRKSRGVKLKEIAAGDEFEALHSGLANRAERVARLENLFNLVEQDFLENNRVWIEREKAIGSKEFTKFIQERVLNQAQVDLCRRLADDIAKEMNQRTYALRESLPSDDEDDASNVTVTVRYEEKPKQETEEGD
jgi:hypothetical protein